MSKKIGRDAKTGQFISVNDAKKTTKYNSR